MEEFNLSADELKNLPLFYRKIYYNEVTNANEEKKLTKYNIDLQCDMMQSSFSMRDISKTVNYKTFRENKHE